jgi:hypothetical protein
MAPVLELGRRRDGLAPLIDHVFRWVDQRHHVWERRQDRQPTMLVNVGHLAQPVRLIGESIKFEVLTRLDAHGSGLIGQGEGL